MNPQKTSEEVISQGLKDLGFLKEPLEEILEKKLFREFYYHKIGHWIGLDVHDDSPYTYKDEEIKFKENMIMTIELNSHNHIFFKFNFFIFVCIRTVIMNI